MVSRRSAARSKISSRLGERNLYRRRPSGGPPVTWSRMDPPKGPVAGLFPLRSSSHASPSADST
eukprot:8643641-Pyramimonas_sp.AAC.1